MTAAQWLVVGLAVVVLAFMAWVFAMNRRDDREDRQARAQMQHGVRRPRHLGDPARQRPGRSWRT